MRLHFGLVPLGLFLRDIKGLYPSQARLPSLDHFSSIDHHRFPGRFMRKGNGSFDHLECRVYTVIF